MSMAAPVWSPVQRVEGLSAHIRALLAGNMSGGLIAGNATTTPLMGLAKEDALRLPADTTFLGSGLLDGAAMSLATLLLTAVLELTALSAVAGIRAKPGGRALYAQALWTNFLNIAIIGPPTYLIAVELFCRATPLPPFERWATCVGLILVHSIGYYAAHRAMHLKFLYNAHKFHHRFNMHVAPSTANAVSLTEYALAYMLPFITGCLVLRPDGPALAGAVAVISLNNLLIHTPALAKPSRWLPSIFVSTADHLDHHRRLTTNYAAPTISIDRILATIFGEPNNKHAQREHVD